MGKPTIRNGVVSISEFIGYEKADPGTETSKYPEEEKQMRFPEVAASETGLAQTKRLASWGCGKFCTELQKNEVDEEVWKGPPLEVTAL